jgi:predicted porin
MENTAVKYAIGLGLTAANVSAGLGTPENVGGFANPTVKVTVTYTFTAATPLISNFLPCKCSFISLKSDAIMRTETLPSP